MWMLQSVMDFVSSLLPALTDDMKMKQSLDANPCNRKGFLAIPPLLQDVWMMIPHSLHNCLQSALKHLVKSKYRLSTKISTLGEKESFKTWGVDVKGHMQAWRENSYWVDQPQEILSGLNNLMKNKHKLDATQYLTVGEKEPSKTWEADLERQMQAWRENSYWMDQPPEVKVSVPEGSLCNLKVKFKIGLPPDAVFNIVVDPENKRVFKNIKEVIYRRVLVDEGQRQVVEVNQAAIWRFLWWSGTISVHVFVDQNRRDHTVKFKQGKAGFMKRFEGTWRVEPLFVDKDLCSPHDPKSWPEYDACSGGKGRVGSLVSLDQLIQPTLVPPPPISWYLRGVTERTTEMLIHDLLAEAGRLRGSAADSAQDQRRAEQDSSDQKMESAVNDSADNTIKKRWCQRRSKRRQNRC